MARNRHLELIDHVGPFALRTAESLLYMVRAFNRLNILFTNS